VTAIIALHHRPEPYDSAALARNRTANSAGGFLARKRKAIARILVLVAAIAVPALAAPDEWHEFDIGNAGRTEVAVEPMPFEKAGDSFPGSAFYYLTQDDAQPGFGEGIHSDAENAPTALDPLGGPVARSMRIDNSGVDRSRALECMTAAIYYEAASEPDAGQRAVAQVVLNRVAHPSFPNTVCGVVYQGSERSTGCQFSFTCDGSLARVPNRMFWLRAENVARQALEGYVFTPVGLATHYHTFAVHPYWDTKLINVANIGAHRFFRMPGPAGAAGAFSFAYGGGEPVAAPHARNAAADRTPDSALDPVAIQHAYEEGYHKAQTDAVAPTAHGLAPVHAAPPPVYSSELQQRGGEALYRGEKLPQATGIKPEYQNSGRWIAAPGT
jgi:spore germination cell wall hydrolase CwlJ-like protein